MTLYPRPDGDLVVQVVDFVAHGIELRFEAVAGGALRG